MTGVFLSLQLCLPEFQQSLLACHHPQSTHRAFRATSWCPFFHHCWCGRLCVDLVALRLTALLSPWVIALAAKCRGSAAVLHTKVLAYRRGARATALQAFTHSTLIAGLAPHLTSQGHGPTAETILTAHYG